MGIFKRPLASFAIVLLLCNLVAADDTLPKGGVTLLGMLNEWIYPQAKFGGAETSDAAVTNTTAIKSKAILTTTDSLDKVLEHYCKRLNVDRNSRNLDDAESLERVTTKRAILIQDLSGDRPNSLFLIAINGPKNSTTLVISRSSDDKVTQIGWSDFRHLSP